MGRVFLSYSHKDKRFARRLGEDLKNRGHDVWIDEGELLAGETLVAKLANALSSVDLVIAIISVHSVNSRWVTFELHNAITREIQGPESDEFVVIPILKSKIDPPPFLRAKVIVDFSDTRKYDTALSLLNKSLFRYELRRINNARPQIEDVPSLTRVTLFGVGICRFRKNLLNEYLKTKNVADLEFHYWPFEGGLEGRPVQYFEGILSACLCYRHLCTICPELPDALLRAWLIANSLLVHCKEAHSLRKSEMTDGQSGVAGMKPATEGDFIIGTDYFRLIGAWCPPREPESFYYGWRQFSIFMLGNISGFIEGEDFSRVSEIQLMPLQVMLNVSDDYEKLHEPDDAYFWNIVQASLNIYFSIKDISSELEAQLISDVFKALEIDSSSAASLRVMYAAYRNTNVGLRMALLKIQAHNQYAGAGQVHDLGFELKVDKV